VKRIHTEVLSCERLKDGPCPTTSLILELISEKKIEQCRNNVKYNIIAIHTCRSKTSPDSYPRHILDKW
jgi:hypothetical protein